MRLVYLILSLSCALIFGQATCKNNCSNNGICKDGFCSCNENYIEPDCSVKAFLIQKGVLLRINQLGNFIAYHIFTETNPIPNNLYLKYDNPQPCTVKVQISKSQALTNEYQERLEVSSKQSVSLNLSSELQSIRNVLIIQIQSQYNSDFTIFYGYQQEDTPTSNDMPIETIFLIVVCIILGIIAVYYCIKKLWDHRHQEPVPPPVLEPQPPVTPPVPEPQSPVTPPVPEPQSPVTPPVLPQIPICSICQQILFTGIPLSITPCRHKFHKHCISQLLFRQQSCHDCPVPVQLNQLQDFHAPN